MHLSLLGLNRLCKALTVLHKADLMPPAYEQRASLIRAGHRLAK